MHPADIEGFVEWNMVECEDCGSQPANDTVTISCDGTNYVPSPTAASISLPTAAPVESSSNGTALNSTQEPELLESSGAPSWRGFQEGRLTLCAMMTGVVAVLMPLVGGVMV